jgi:hypothetical protein
MSSSTRRRLRTAVEAMEPRVVPSVTLQVRYDYDTTGFFAPAERRQAMEGAASLMGAMLGDSLAAIVPSGSNTWTAAFAHPVTGVTVELENLVVPANTLIVYAAGADLPGNQTGEGGAGAWAGGGTSAWLDLLRGRGEPGALAAVPTDYAPWGGLIRFDTTGTNWYFGADAAGLGGAQTDFRSVAVHELGHLLGIGVSGSWRFRVDAASNTFRGPASMAANGGAPVPLADDAHWGTDVRSDGQPPAMAPVLWNGTRTPFTRLDLAALRDVGWELPGAPATPTVGLAAGSLSVPERGGVARLNVVRSSGDGAASVRYTVTGQGATPGVDVVGAMSGVVTFAAGQTTAPIALAIADDRLREGNERFVVTLASPTGAALGGTTAATVTIVDDERAPQGDRDGDGRADFLLFAPADARWQARLTTGQPFGALYGASRWASLPVPADYDGDGRVDLAVFRPAEARWQVSLSRGGAIDRVYGQRNLADLPVPADYDGDGRADLVVFRVAEGRWLGTLSGGGTLDVRNAATTLAQVPVPADYDGDGRADLALFQPADARWIIPPSAGGPTRTVLYGRTRWGSLPVPADYDGDGRADIAVFRPLDARWQIQNSAGGATEITYGARALAQVPAFAPIAALRRLRVLA